MSGLKELQGPVDHRSRRSSGSLRGLEAHGCLGRQQLRGGGDRGRRNAAALRSDGHLQLIHRI